MTVLYILAAIAVLLVLIANLYVKLSFVTDGENALFVQILCFKYYIFGEKEKPPNLRKFKIKRFRKDIEKRRQKRTRVAIKKPKQKKKIDVDAIKKLLSAIRDLLRKKGKIEIKKLIIGVGTDDPHRTAIEYGVVVQSVQYFYEFLGSQVKTKPTRDAQISVYPNFVGESYAISISIRLKLKIINGVLFGLKILVQKLKTDKPKAVKNTKNRKVEKENDGEQN